VLYVYCYRGILPLPVLNLVLAEFLDNSDNSISISSGRVKYQVIVHLLSGDYLVSPTMNKIIMIIFSITGITSIVTGIAVSFPFLFVIGLLLTGFTGGHFIIGRRFLNVTLSVSRFGGRQFVHLPSSVSDPRADVIASLEEKNPERLESMENDLYSHHDEFTVEELMSHGGFLSSSHGEDISSDDAHPSSEKASSRVYLPLIISLIGSGIIVLYLLVSFSSTGIGNQPLVKILLDFGLVIFIVTLFIFLLLIIRIMFPSRFSRKALDIPLELSNLLSSDIAKTALKLAIVMMFFYAIVGLLVNWLSPAGILLSLVLFIPLFLVMQLTGRYFPLFFLHQLFKFRNWDYLEGRPVNPPGENNPLLVVKNIMRRILGLVAVSGLIIGVISMITGIGKVITSAITGDNPITSLGFLTTIFEVLDPPVSTILLFIIGIGPLLTLLISPFSNLEVWIHQGIYDKLNSNWSIQELKENVTVYHDVARLPLGESSSMAFRGGRGKRKLTLPYLVLFTSMLLITVSFTGLSQLFVLELPVLAEAVWLALRATEIVYIYAIWTALKSLDEERALVKLINYSRELNLDLINETMYGEALVHKQSSLDEWVDRFKDTRWGVPHFFQGMGYNSLVLQTGAYDGSKVHYMNRLRKHQNKQKVADKEKEFKGYQNALLLKDSLPKQMVLTALLNSGGILEEKLDFQKAIEAYREVIEKEPKNQLASERLGYCYQKIGKLEESERYYKEALKIDNKSSSTWYHYAGLLCVKNDVEGAFQKFKTGLELDSELLRKAIESGDLTCLESYQPFQELTGETREYDVPRSEYLILQEIEELFKLKMRQFDDCPHSYGYQTENGHVVGISLGRMRITSLPENISNLLHLKCLNLQNNDITRLPDSLKKLEKLETLTIYNNPLEEIPEYIGTFKNLKWLKLKADMIGKLPEQISKLEKIEELFFVGSLPDPIPEHPEWYRKWRKKLLENGATISNDGLD